MYYVYLLRLSNEDFYAGSTKDLKARIRKHKNGEVLHTSKFRPVRLVWFAGAQYINVFVMGNISCSAVFAPVNVPR